MTKIEIDSLLRNYFTWLKENTSVDLIDNEWTEITTPYLDRHNDCLQIYVKKEESNILFTDDGYILDDLILSGCELDSPKRQAILETTLNGFGVTLNDNKLQLRTSVNNFPQKKNDFIQAMLATNDLFYLAKSATINFFYEDVVTWFDNNEIRYVPKVKFLGKTGFDNMFDFSIPKSKNAFERLVDTMVNPTKVNLSNLIFKWLDTKNVRPAESGLYVIINDNEKIKQSTIYEAFSSYGITTINWSEKEKYKDQLVL